MIPAWGAIDQLPRLMQIPTTASISWSRADRSAISTAPIARACRPTRHAESRLAGNGGGHRIVGRRGADVAQGSVGRRVDPPTGGYGEEQPGEHPEAQAMRY